MQNITAHDSFVIMLATPWLLLFTFGAFVFFCTYAAQCREYYARAPRRRSRYNAPNALHLINGVIATGFVCFFVACILVSLHII